MKALHLLFAAKALALLAAGGFLYVNYQAKAEEQQPAAAGEAKKDSGAAQIPEIPEKGLSLSKAAELRNQLLMMRKEIEQKTEKLNIARQGYDRSKADIENKLRRIEEERKLLEETLHKERKAKEERLSEALEFIVKMDPKKAAPLLEGMDRDLVMQLLRKLPPRQVTRLLESVSPKKATEFLEYYTRIRSGREFELFRELGLCQGTGSEEGGNDKPANKQGAGGQPAAGSGAAPAAAAGGAGSSAAAPSASAGGAGSSAAAPAAPAGGAGSSAAAPSAPAGGQPAAATIPSAGGTPAASAAGPASPAPTAR
jgi:flagellar motility protein MotE (MotC chaperone)